MDNFNTTYKQEIAFVRLLVPFTLGIIMIYDYKSSCAQGYLILITTLLFLYLCAKNTAPKPGKIRPNDGINGLFCHMLMLLTGLLSSTLYDQRNNTDYYVIKNITYLKITISEEPVDRQNIILFTANVTKCVCKNQPQQQSKATNHIFKVASGRMKVSLLKNTHFPITLQYGDELVIPANFIEVPSPLNPSEFDYKKWLATQNIYHQTILKQEEIIKIKSHQGNWLRSRAISLRTEQIKIFRRIIKDDDAFAVATTLILGYRADLSPEILDIYSKTGTIHALSVSGMHVALLYMVLNYMLWFLDRKRGARLIKTLLVLSALWFYTLLTGFSPSALRACMMISVYIMAKLFNRNTNSYNVIAFTAFCLLLYQPFLIWDVGFQLSFIAVLGLIYFQPKIQNCLPLKRPWLANLWSIIAMSLSAQLATFPLSVYYFHQFPVYFLLSNLFLTLPATLIMYTGLIVLTLRFEALGPLFEWLITFTNAGLNRIADLPFSGITAIWMSRLEIFLLSLTLLLLIMACERRKKALLLTSMLLLLCLQTSISYHKLKSLYQKKIVRFILKKNYAVAAISAHQAVLFTDLTQESKAFRFSVKPALDQHRITQITFIKANVTSDLKDNLIFDQLN